MYYEILFGSGTYQMYRYVVETEEPTTDYGALVDILIDYLRENVPGLLLDMDKYEWVDDGTRLEEIANPEWGFNDDEFISGGNYGDVLVHYGDFRINEIKLNEIGSDIVINEDGEKVDL